MKDNSNLRDDNNSGKYSDVIPAGKGMVVIVSATTPLIGNPKAPSHTRGAQAYVRTHLKDFNVV